MSAVAVRAHGRHRKRWSARPVPAARPDGHGLILAEAAAGEMTLGELRDFLGRAEAAAWEAGVIPDRLRFRVYIRSTGHARGISVKIPGVPG